MEQRLRAWSACVVNVGMANDWLGLNTFVTCWHMSNVCTVYVPAYVPA